MSIPVIRKEYHLFELDTAQLKNNPFDLFYMWIDEAEKAGVKDPSAMILSTCSHDGKPSSRVVLLKQLTKEGFVFFSNYNSRKGKQLKENPYASIVFFWPEQERQVRVEGKIKKTTVADSDIYFQSRPQGSKISAWASPQSQEVSSRAFLEKLYHDFEQQFKNEEIKRPNNWGGYCLVPTLIEFWQGRENRLNDRFQYTLVNNGWEITRLAP
jgi:pyridoxamine 5'-phosphate oxidase